MTEISKANITTLPKVIPTLMPNIGVEILYRDTNKTSNTLVIDGHVEVTYDTYLLEGMPHFEAAVVDAANRQHVYARLPLTGIRLIRFLYKKRG
jgi:hypothetical protein